MAHVGKKYPVAFRRDWSTQVSSYQLAMARDYFFVAPSASGTIGGHLIGKVLRAIERDATTVVVPIWRSDPTNINGRSVTIEVTLTSQDPFGVMQNRLEIFDAIQGSVARATGITGATSGYRILAGHFDQTWQPHPTLFSTTIGVIWNLIAAEWSDF